MLINLLPDPVTLHVEGHGPTVIEPSGLVMHAEYGYDADGEVLVGADDALGAVPRCHTTGHVPDIQDGTALARLIDEHPGATFIVARAVAELMQNPRFVYPHDIAYNGCGRAVFARALAYIYH